VQGFMLFCLFGSIGAIANVDVAEWLYDSPNTGTFWWAAGAAGALMSAFWNYAMSTLFVWRAR
jgi:dolichol-phosphate mannosyltransferase